MTVATKATKKNAAASTNAAAAKSVREVIAFAFTAATKAVGALFNIEAEKRSSNGPIMSGTIDLDNAQVPVSGFLKIAQESGKEYLALSIGSEKGVHYYGKLFRSEGKKKFQNAPDYTGFITLLPCDSANQYSDDEWKDAPTLKITAYKRRNANGGSRIALNIMPTEVQKGELVF